jgi:hypothetical protein
MWVRAFQPSYGKRICLMGYSFAFLNIRFWYWSMLAWICNVFLWNNIVDKRLSKLTFPWCIILVRQSPTTLCLWDGNILIVWWSGMDFSLMYHLDFEWKAWLRVWKHEPWSWRTFKHEDQPFFFISQKVPTQLQECWTIESKWLYLNISYILTLAVKLAGYLLLCNVGQWLWFWCCIEV